MGPHLELICLLQAAEIERLCQFLEEFKMKYSWDDSDSEKMSELSLTDIPMKCK